MKYKYSVVVLGGYSGKVAEKYFTTKPKMLRYVSTVMEYASEVKIVALAAEESRWGPTGEVKDWSKVDWA